MSLPTFALGDIVCTHDDSWLSKAIRWAEKSPGEKGAKSSHCGVMYSDTLICEALWKVKIQPLEPTLEDRFVDIFRPVFLPGEQYAMRKKLEKWEGEVYAWYKIFGHLGDATLSKGWYNLTGQIWSPYVCRRLFFMDKYPICSWVVAYAFEEIKKNYFNVPPWAAQPDDIHDFCIHMNEIGLMERVYTSPGW